jgi:hypothetical protein
MRNHAEITHRGKEKENHQKVIQGHLFKSKQSEETKTGKQFFSLL